MPKRTPPSPDPITVAVGQRVLQMRKDMGWSQEELGKRMAALGTGWSRISVQKLETGRRGAVFVQELLALAVTFDVNPSTLLLPPHTEGTVEIIPGEKIPAAQAWDWLDGRAPLHPVDDDGSSAVAFQLRARPQGRRKF